MRLGILGLLPGKTFGFMKKKRADTSHGVSALLVTLLFIVFHPQSEGIDVFLISKIIFFSFYPTIPSALTLLETHCVRLLLRRGQPCSLQAGGVPR